MAGLLPGNPSQNEIASHRNSIHEREEVNHFARKWYFSKQEIDDHSPSRKDGISQQEESYYRKLYCTFLQELGIELKVPQLTIATAIMFCHRFYMRQSHAKNCWKTVATACMFVGCKVEETPRWLNEVIVVAYKQMYKWDPSAPRRIKQKDVYDKQKELIINAERFLLATLAFNLNIEHPYKSLVGVLKRLEQFDKELPKIAWNYVNDWLRTPLCLQYKPHYVAAGSVFLAAKIRKVKLPKEKGNVWWMQFDVSPKILEEVVQQMVSLLKENEKQAQQAIRAKRSAPKPIAEKELSGSPQSCTLSGTVVTDSGILKSSQNAGGLNGSVSVSSKDDMEPVAGDVHRGTRETSQHPTFSVGKQSPARPQSSKPSGSPVAQNPVVLPSMAGAGGLNNSVLVKCKGKQASTDLQDPLKETKLRSHASDSGSASSAVEDCEDPVKGKSDLDSSCKVVTAEGSNIKLNIDRIRDAVRKRKHDRTVKPKLAEEENDEMDGEAWIQRELESGIMLQPADTEKRMRETICVLYKDLLFSWPRLAQNRPEFTLYL